MKNEIKSKHLYLIFIGITTLLFPVFILLNNLKVYKIMIQEKQKVINALSNRIFLFSDYCCNRHLSPKTTFLDKNNNPIYLEEIVNTPKIALYINKFHCESCVDDVFKEFKKKIKSKLLSNNAIILAENYNTREINLKFDFSGFDVPILIMHSYKSKDLNEFNSIGKPYFFFINTTFDISNFWVPHSEIDSLINDHYFNLLLKKINNSRSEFLENDNFKIINPVVHIGNVKIGHSNNVQFKLINLGKQPCIIESISSSCGCLIPQIDSKILEPDSLDSINVIFTPTSKGYFSKSITIRTKSKVNPFKRMWIKGYAE